MTVAFIVGEARIVAGTSIHWDNIRLDADIKQ